MDSLYINIQDYIKDSDYELNRKIYTYSLIVIILLIWVIFLAFFNQRMVYYQNVLLIEDKDVVLNINHNDLDILINNNQLFINENNYYYSIISIELLDNSTTNYKVYLDINLGKRSINNDSLQCQILIKKECIMEYFIKTLKGV